MLYWLKELFLEEAAMLLDLVRGSAALFSLKLNPLSVL